MHASTRRPLPRLRTALLAFALTLSFAAAAQAEVKVRLATAAPDGSLQVKVMRAVAKKITADTKGEVTFQIFAGGTVGDDLGVIRKMKLGQLDAAGFSGVGVGEILPAARVLELPFYFESPKQVDCVRDKMQGWFEQEFEKNGFVLLGWAGVGSVHLFSKKEVKSTDEMSGTKPWVWKGDPIGEGTFKAFGLTPTPLQLQDVLTSLQTGLIDTFYNTPALAIALQWNRYASYMIDMPLVTGLGAILVKKELWDQVSPESQATIKKIFAETLPRLVSKTSDENDKSITLMEKDGLKRIAVPPAEAAKFRAKGAEVAQKLTGSLYTADFLQEVERHRATCK
jgi:TRAP-type C4-dicarboxylate transport system substrate-binding protein